MQKANVDDANADKAVDDLFHLLDRCGYKPSTSLDMSTLDGLQDVLMQFKRLPAGWKASVDGKSALDKDGKPLAAINANLAQAREDAGKSGILKIIE